VDQIRQHEIADAIAVGERKCRLRMLRGQRMQARAFTTGEDQSNCFFHSLRTFRESSSGRWQWIIWTGSNPYYRPDKVPSVIATAATERMVAAAFRAAREVGLDPLLVLAVISVESRFNPIAESVMGAKGLMQIIPRYHPVKLAAVGGEAAVWDPESNIVVGA